MDNHLNTAITVILTAINVGVNRCFSIFDALRKIIGLEDHWVTEWANKVK